MRLINDKIADSDAEYCGDAFGSINESPITNIALALMHC